MVSSKIIKSYYQFLKFLKVQDRNAYDDMEALRHRYNYQRNKKMDLQDQLFDVEYKMKKLNQEYLCYLNNEFKKYKK
jgi:hypothetical protein